MSVKRARTYSNGSWSLTADGPSVVTVRRVLLAFAIVALSLAAIAAAHMAFIEIGKDVVVLRSTDAAGKSHSRRLWCVDHEGAVWLHSKGKSWHELFAASRSVQLKRNGALLDYIATPVPGPHPEIDRLLRSKYGLADRWVRFLAPDDEDVLVVRLDRTSASVSSR